MHGGSEGEVGPFCRNGPSGRELALPPHGFEHPTAERSARSVSARRTYLHARLPLLAFGIHGFGTE